MNFINNRRRTRGQAGFTLIELLVVIAILAVLSGVVVFAVSGLNDNSKESACKIDKRTIQTAVEAFRAQNDDYPTASPIVSTSYDGLDAVRGEGLLDNDSKSNYWEYRFTAGPGNTPTYVVTTDPDGTKVSGCNIP